MTIRLSVLGIALSVFLVAGCGEEPKKESEQSPLPAHDFDKKEMPKAKGDKAKMG
jgi:hypothetical protein